MTEQDARDFLTALGAEIAHFRRARHMTRADLAALVGVSATKIGRMERGDEGTAAPTPDVFRIAKALGVPYGVLVIRAEQATGLGKDPDASVLF